MPKATPLKSLFGDFDIPPPDPLDKNKIHANVPAEELMRLESLVTGKDVSAHTIERTISDNADDSELVLLHNALHNLLRNKGFDYAVEGYDAGTAAVRVLIYLAHKIYLPTPTRPIMFRDSDDFSSYLKLINENRDTVSAICSLNHLFKGLRSASFSLKNQNPAMAGQKSPSHVHMDYASDTIRVAANKTGYDALDPGLVGIFLEMGRALFFDYEAAGDYTELLKTKEMPYLSKALGQGFSGSTNHYTNLFRGIGVYALEDAAINRYGTPDKYYASIVKPHFLDPLANTIASKLNSILNREGFNDRKNYFLSASSFLRQYAEALNVQNQQFAAVRDSLAQYNQSIAKIEFSVRQKLVSFWHGS